MCIINRIIHIRMFSLLTQSGRARTAYSIIEMLNELFGSDNVQLRQDNGAYNNLKAIFGSEAFANNYSAHLKPSNLVMYFYAACSAHHVYTCFIEKNAGQVLVFSGLTLNFLNKFNMKKEEADQFCSFISSMPLWETLTFIGSYYCAVSVAPKGTFMALGTAMTVSFIYNREQFLGSIDKALEALQINNTTGNVIV